MASNSRGLQIFRQRGRLVVAARGKIHVNLAAENAVVAGVHFRVAQEGESGCGGEGDFFCFDAHAVVGDEVV